VSASGVKMVEGIFKWIVSFSFIGEFGYLFYSDEGKGRYMSLYERGVMCEILT
jgi:hypothetical protein